MLTRRGCLRGFLGALATGAGGCAHRELAGPFPRATHESPPNYTVDVHCHVFNGSDLPISGFIERIANLPPEVVDYVLRQFEKEIQMLAPSGAQEISALGTTPLLQSRADKASLMLAQARPMAKSLLPSAGSYLGSDIAVSIDNFLQVLDLVTRFRFEIAADLARTYSTVDLFTPAMVDYDYWTGNDVPKTPIGTQLVVQALVAKLSMKGGLPGAPGARVHPLAPYNPLREIHAKLLGRKDYRPFSPDHVFTADSRYDCAAAAPPPMPDGTGAFPGGPTATSAMDLVRFAVEQSGFVGVKIYPPVGFRPLDNATLGPPHPEPDKDPAWLDLALRALYAYCEAEQVPIMSHAGSSNGFEPGFGMLGMPDNWRPVLAAYPALRLNLAHFGHLQGADTSRGAKACEAWIRQAAILMTAYPNVYADVGDSHLPVYKDYAAAFTETLKEIAGEFPVVKKRLMFGTDSWLNRLDPNGQFFVDAFTQALDQTFDASVRHDIMGGNALRFLGLVDDVGAPAPSRARKRLRAFYGAIAPPPWLG